MVYIVGRLMQSVVVLFAMSLIAFAAVFMIGNPIELLIDPAANEAERHAAEIALGLDRPVWMQYLQFLNRLLHFDLGHSFSASLPVATILGQRLPATIELTAVAFAVSLIGVPLGLIAGLKPKSVAGRSILTTSILGLSLPNFWVGLMLILLFSVNLGWLPAVGRGETITILGTHWAIFTVDGLRHLILPGITLGLFNLALLTRLAQAGMREAMLTDYVRFGRAKGLRRQRLIWVHAFRNILIPIVTVQGLELANLLAGALLTEVIFAYPGIGRAAVEAIQYLDRPVLVGYMMFVAAAFVIINLAVDLLYAVIDPRIRLDGDQNG